MRAEDILELIFPSNIYCIACGGIIDKSRPYAMCDKCVRSFRWANGRTCDKCGKILQDSYIHDICIDCRQIEHVFTRGYTCVQYGISERDLLLSFKYGGKAFVGRKLAEIMADRIKMENFHADIILPVPLHKTKLKKRGYNQAEIMARHLARHIAAPYAGKLLLRVAKTPAMSKLSPEERRRNMEGAFAVAPGGKERMKGKKALLVDDIFTTGSTADACSEALLDAGAAEVRLISFASGANLTHAR